MQVPFPHNLPIPVISQPFLGCKSSCFAKLGSNLCGKGTRDFNKNTSYHHECIKWQFESLKNELLGQNL